MSTRSLQSILMRLTASCTVKNVLTTDPARSSSGSLSISYNPTVENGNGHEQANRAWDYSGTLSSGGTQVVDLYDFGSLDSGSGAGADIVGQSLELFEIVAIIIQNLSVDDDGSDSDSGDPGALEIEPDVTAGWDPIGSHTVALGGALEPGGLLCKLQPHANGFEVTDAVSHRIILTANGGSVDYRILVFGKSV